jgi:hypothetical protein
VAAEGFRVGEDEFAARAGEGDERDLGVRRGGRG